MTNYLNIFSRRAATATPQTLPDPRHGAEQRRRAYAFALDDWTRLDRFLILGAEGGSYYAGERTLTRDNAAAVLRVLAVRRPTRRRPHRGRQRGRARPAQRPGAVRPGARRVFGGVGHAPGRAGGAAACRVSRAPGRTCSSSPATSRGRAAGAGRCAGPWRRGTRGATRRTAWLTSW